MFIFCNNIFTAAMLKLIKQSGDKRVYEGESFYEDCPLTTLHIILYSGNNFTLQGWVISEGLFCVLHVTRDFFMFSETCCIYEWLVIYITKPIYVMLFDPIQYKLTGYNGRYNFAGVFFGSFIARLLWVIVRLHHGASVGDSPSVVKHIINCS